MNNRCRHPHARITPIFISQRFKSKNKKNNFVVIVSFLVGIAVFEPFIRSASVDKRKFQIMGKAYRMLNKKFFYPVPLFVWTMWAWAKEDFQRILSFHR